MQTFKLLIAILGVGALSGCVAGGPIGGPRVAAPQNPVQGEWIGTDGVAISSFNPGGSFTSRFAETGETLTTGNYNQRDPRTYDLNFYSIRSQRNIAATCALVEQNRLNCTSDSGATFALLRRQTA